MTTVDLRSAGLVPAERLGLELQPLEHTTPRPPDHRSASGQPVPTGAPGAPRPPRAGMAERAGWSIAAAGGLLGLLHAWTASSASSTAALVTPVLVVASLLALARIWTARSIATHLQLGLLAIGSASLCMRAWQTVRVSPGYGTDALAFNEYAARLLLDGVNPYGASMSPALTLFQVPPDYSTFRLDGSAIDLLSYPAGSFLAYVPPLLLGLPAHAGTAVNLLCWLVSGLLLWRMLPPALRWVAPALLGLSVYTEYVVGGITDAVWLPFVLVALHRWDRFADASAGRVRWLGPLALGAAMSVKQTPWFVLPFLLVALAVEARSRGRSPIAAPAAYAAVAGAVFAVVNLPFALWSPSAWLSGTVLPLVESTVPDGQGLVSLAVHAGLGGGSLALFSVAGALFLAGALVALPVHYGHLKRAWVLLVPLAFAFPTRSLGSYLIMLLPAALVAALSVAPAPARTAVTGRRWRLVPAVLLAGAGLATTAALTVPPPVTVEVVDVRSTGAWQTVAEVVVRLENNSDEHVPVAFTLNDDGRTTSFWRAADDTPLRPGEVRRTTLRAPDVASMPDVDQPFRVLAFMRAPAAVASSDPYSGSRLSVSLTPVDQAGEVPVGQEVVLLAQLRDERGVPAERAHVPVSLSQVVYAEAALLPGNSSINGGPQGQTPVQVLTDARGQARFVLRGVQAQRDPVYYQAWVSPADTAPHGYSGSVLVRFTP